MLKTIFKFTGGFFILLVSVFFILLILQPRIPLGAFSNPISIFLSSLTQHDQVISGQFYLVPGSWTTIAVEECTVDLTGDKNFEIKGEIHSATTHIHLWSLFTGNLDLNGIFVKGVNLDILTADRKETQSDYDEEWLDKIQASPLSFPLQQLGPIELTDIGISIRQQGEQPPITFQLDKANGVFSRGAHGQIEIDAALNGRRFSTQFKGDFLLGNGDRKTTWSFNSKFPHSSASGKILLDFSSEKIRVSSQLTSSAINIGAILDELQIAKGVNLKLDTVNTDFNSSGSTLAELINNLTLTIKGAGGRYQFRAPNTQASFLISLNQATLAASPGDKISFIAEGELATTPIRIEMECGDPRSKIAGSRKEIPFKNHIFIAGTGMELSGKIPIPFNGTGASLKIMVHGEKLSTLNDLLKLQLPDVGPYAMKGVLNFVPKGCQLDKLELQIGSSRLNGTMLLDIEAVPPAIAVHLQSPHLQLDDFKGILDETTALLKTKAQKLDQEQLNKTVSETGRRFFTNQSVIESYNASLSINIAEVFSGEDFLGRGLLKIEQRDGRFSIDPLQVQFSDGNAQIHFSMEPVGEERLYNLKISIDKLDYGFIGRWVDDNSDLEGHFSLRLSLQSKSPNFRGIMANGSGTINLLLQPEQQQAGIIDLWAVNLLSSLTQYLDPTEESKINCAAGRFTLSDGILINDALLIDTTQIQINGDLTVDLKKRWIEGRFRPRPKRPQFFSLATPVKISGPLSDLKSGVPTGGGVGTLIRLATSYIVVPLQWIVLDKLPKDGTAACMQIMEPENQKEKP